VKVHEVEVEVEVEVAGGLDGLARGLRLSYVFDGIDKRQLYNEQ
jgi:hypothetical protein